MSESGIWKTVESSYFDRLKLLISQQLSRHNFRGSLEVAGCSDEVCDISSDGYETSAKNWKRSAELVEEMEPKCPTYHNEVIALRQLELMEKETTNGAGSVTLTPGTGSVTLTSETGSVTLTSETGSVTLTSIQRDLEARQISARKKVRCRQHRLNCVLDVFELEADNIISQLESYEGTEVDFSSSNRVMRLKGMVKEAILTAENLGSARREAITVELISGSCGLLRKLLSRLDEPLDAQPIEDRTVLQPVQRTLFKAVEKAHPREAEDDEAAETHLTQQKCEVQMTQVTGGCEVCVTLENDDKTEAIRDGDIPSEGDDDTATRETLAATSTSPPTPFSSSSSSSPSFSSSSFSSSPSSSSYSSSSSSSSSSATNSCTSAMLSSPSIVSPSSFSCFRISYFDACYYYSCYLLSFLLSLLSSFPRAISSERGLRWRSKLSPATPQFALKLVDLLKGFFKEMDRIKDMEKDEMKNRIEEGNESSTESCASEEELEAAGSWQDVSTQWIRFSLESVCEGKSWHRMVHNTKGWMSSATARLSVLSMAVKINGRGWKSLRPGDRCYRWMISVALVCLVVCSLSIICFDQSPTVPIRAIGRMINWIMFDPVVDLRHRGLPPI